jgi:hypothetical protein
MVWGSNNGRLYFCPNWPDQLQGPHILLFDGYRGFLPVKWWEGRDIDHSSAFSIQVKNGAIPLLFLMPLQHEPG